MKNTSPNFNLKMNFKRNTKFCFSIFFLLFISFSSLGQNIDIVMNSSTDDGADDIGDVIDYTVTVNNTGTVALNSVSISDTLGTTFSLSSGDDNTNSILDPNEIWIYTSTYSIIASDITAGNIQNTVSVSSVEITTPVTYLNDTIVHEDDYASVSLVIVKCDADGDGIDDFTDIDDDNDGF